MHYSRCVVQRAVIKAANSSVGPITHIGLIGTFQ